MKIVSNEKMIQRNARIGQITSLGSMVILIGGFVLSLTSRDTNQLGLMWGALVVGFILSQVGIYYGNRWSRRPDKALDQALKGLDDRYTVYHFTGPVSHLLIGPAGVWILEVYHQMGTIVYEKNRWKQRGGGFLQGYLRLFGQDNLGRPDLDIEVDTDRLKRFLTKKMPDQELPAIQTALVFVHEKAEIAVEDAPHPTLKASELKEFLRKTTKGKALAPEKAKQIQDAIEGHE